MNPNQFRESKTKWYDVPNLLIAFTFLFPPIGLYGIYKNSKMTRRGKIVFTFFVLLATIYVYSALFQDNQQWYVILKPDLNLFGLNLC